MAPVAPGIPVAPDDPGIPVTDTHSPCGPVAPVGPGPPVGPVAPVGPRSPVGPVAPVGPRSPVAPVAPSDPGAPVGPGAPSQGGTITSTDVSRAETAKTATHATVASTAGARARMRCARVVATCHLQLASPRVNPIDAHGVGSPDGRLSEFCPAHPRAHRHRLVPTLEIRRFLPALVPPLSCAPCLAFGRT